MKKLFTVFALLCCLSLSACNTFVGHKAAEGHQAVFGCWPKGYTPPRTLDAVGPKESNCGKPVYKRPACSEGSTAASPAPCQDCAR